MMDKRTERQIDRLGQRIEVRLLQIAEQLAGRTGTERALVEAMASLEDIREMRKLQRGGKVAITIDGKHPQDGRAFTIAGYL